MVVLRVQGLILLHGAIHPAWAVRGSKSGISGRNQRSFFLLRLWRSRAQIRAGAACLRPALRVELQVQGVGCKVQRLREGRGPSVTRDEAPPSNQTQDVDCGRSCARAVVRQL